MELNEVNSPLAKLMTFNKVGPSTASGSDAFATLLNRTEPKDRPAPENKDIKNVKADNRADDKNVRVDDKSADKKVNPKKNDVKNKATDKRNPASSDASAEQAPQTDKSQLVDNSKDIKTQPIDEAPVVDSSSDIQNSTPAVEEISGETPKLSDMAIPLDLLALMGTINVINPQTSEVIQTTGAELAALLAGKGNIQAVQLPADGSAQPTLQLVPAEGSENIVTIPTDSKIDLSQFQPLEEGDKLGIDLSILTQNKETNQANATKIADVKASADDMVNEKIGEQAAKIADVIGENDKLKIKVSTHEEKIAQLSSRDLLIDAKLVDDAATSVSAKPAVVAANANAEALKQAPQANAAGLNNQNMNATPLYNVAAPAPIESNVASASAPALAEANSATLAASVAPGSEFVKAAKADAADNQTSFRDVYKGMSKEVADQVKVNITKSAVKGVDKIDISLKPEDLGKIEVKMQIGKDGKLQAHIISSRPETMEILQKEIQSLEKAFNDAGFQTDEGSLSFSFREGNQANQNQERENGLRNFIGDIFEREASNDILNAEAFQNQSWDGKSGLNIRV